MYSVTTTGTSKIYEYYGNGNLRYEKQPNGTVIREYRWDQRNRLVRMLAGTHESVYESCTICRARSCSSTGQTSDSPTPQREPTLSSPGARSACPAYQHPSGINTFGARVSTPLGKTAARRRAWALPSETAHPAPSVRELGHQNIRCGSRICQKRSGSTVVRSHFGQGFEQGSDDYFYTRDRRRVNDRVVCAGPPCCIGPGRVCRSGRAHPPTSTARRCS
jgi:hypothetical protein